MPIINRDTFLRYETKPEEEEGFVKTTAASVRKRRESGVVATQEPVKRGRGKRSVEDMMASMGNEVAQSKYALDRIAAIEDQIAKVLSLCTPQSRELVLKQRPSLRRYL